jgi:hypothetical protein
MGRVYGLGRPCWQKNLRRPRALESRAGAVSSHAPHKINDEHDDQNDDDGTDSDKHVS